MTYPKYHLVLSNFDVSVIIYFYRWEEILKFSLSANKYFFERNGIEVIIVLGVQYNEEELLAFVKNNSLINWKIITKRNLCVAPFQILNLAIKHSTKKYILVLDSESVFYTDVIFKFRYLAEFYRNCFFISKVTFGNYFPPKPSIDILEKSFMSYDAIFCMKEYLLQVGGYDDFLGEWGRMQDKLRTKLEYFGISKMFIDDAVIFHYEDSSSREKQGLDIEHLVNSLKLKRRLLSHSTQDFINRNEDDEVTRLVYNYQNNTYSALLCENYLSKFRKYWISDKNIFLNSYKIIALMQTHNEDSNMPGVLKHLDEVCDGIIMLDDLSTDGTYENAVCEKMLLKVQKERTEFNDLENRNILLDLASFFKIDWLFFIDADERFDNRYNNLYEVVDNNYTLDTISFWLVNAWDSPYNYRMDLKDSARYSKEGVFSRARMFRNNKGRMQIVLRKSRKLHFPPVPTNIEAYPQKILLVHYGLQDAERRRNKYKFYEQEDGYEKTYFGDTYGYLLDKDPCLLPIREIKL